MTDETEAPDEAPETNAQLSRRAQEIVAVMHHGRVTLVQPWVEVQKAEIKARDAASARETAAAEHTLEIEAQAQLAKEQLDHAFRMRNSRQNMVLLLVLIIGVFTLIGFGRAMEGMWIFSSLGFAAGGGGAVLFWKQRQDPKKGPDQLPPGR